MPRLLSVSLTEPQVRAKAKTVTRRLGWWTDKRGRRMLRHGDRVTLCRKVMGRRLGEPLVRIVDVRVVDVRRERLDAITPEDVAREGFPGWTPAEFVDFFCGHMRCAGDAEVTRIEWEYLENTEVQHG